MEFQPPKLRGFTVAKRPDVPNEDRWAIADDGLAIAISDGASVSFDPAPWADLLVHDFVAGVELTEEWLRSATARYQSQYDPENMDWMRAGAFERGSFASLLGLRRQLATSVVEVSGVGDSLLALTRRGEVIRSWPYTEAVQFDASPQLLATVNAENAVLFEQDAQLPSLELDLLDMNADAMLMMTDALGHWLLRNPDAASQLLEIQDDEQFAVWVDSRRAAGELRRDDTTLIVVPV